MKENLSVYPGVHGAQEVVDIDEYSRTTKCCHKKLEEIWKDLEMSDVVQEQTLQDITRKALGVWNGAVEHAEQHRNKIRETIDEAAAEMRVIAEQLGDFADIDDPNSSMASLLISPGKTLKRQYDEVMGELETWKRKREARVKEHDEIQGQINEIRESLGQPLSSTKAKKGSITKSNIDFLKLELEKMRAERVRRERTLESTLAKLRKISIELGVDDAEAAAEVHPSLRSYHSSMRGHYFSFSSNKATAEPSSQQTAIALSDAVFKGLDNQLEEMGSLKEEREARLAEMHEVLNNMWNMLEVPPSDDNRSFFEKMLQAPARLHSHTLEKCNEEIGRLEAEQAKAMKVMIQSKSAEIARICEETCLPVPNLGVLVDDSENVGQVAEVLSKLVRMLAEVTVIVEQREPIMKVITDVEEAFKEIHWHFLHKQDNHFNNRGRDANRLLQRVIRAEDKKKKLPKLISKLNTLLDDWQSSTGQRFALGRVDYRSDVLSIIESELATMNEFKPKKPDPKKKGQAGKPPRDPAKSTHPTLVSSAAIAAMCGARDIKSQPGAAPLDRPTTAPVTSLSPSAASNMQPMSIAPSGTASMMGDNCSVSEAPAAMMHTPSAPVSSGSRQLNPLQDLVNNLANASASSRTGTRGQDRYAPTLASLQVDDSVNLGSRNPSPGPVLTMPVLGATSPKESACISTQPDEYSYSYAPPLKPRSHSPSISHISQRSLQSEALSQLSCNPGAITFRKNKKVPAGKEGLQATSPTSKAPTPKRSPVPEHSVMHTGMMS